MLNPFGTNAHVWQPIFNPFSFLHDVYASEDVSFGSSYDLIGHKNSLHSAIEYGYVYLADGSESDRFSYNNSHTKYLTIHPYGCNYNTDFCGQVFKIKPNAGYTVNLKNSDTGTTYSITPSNPFEIPLTHMAYHKFEFLSITKDEAEETEPESDEEETDPDQTEYGSTGTSQSFSFKPVDTDEPEKSNIGFYVGAVAVLAASVWYFTSQ